MRFHGRPERREGPPGGLVVCRQPRSGPYVEMRWPDSSRRGRRTGGRIKRSGSVRRTFAIASSIVLGLVVALVVVQFFAPRIGIRRALLAVGLIVVLSTVIPASLIIERSLRGGWPDGALWAYFAAEIAVTTMLWRLSSGGWFNYAITAVLIALH